MLTVTELDRTNEYAELAVRCLALGIGIVINAHGQPTSVHHCQAGDHDYTVCPPSPDEGADCGIVPTCPSYDPDRDPSWMFS